MSAPGHVAEFELYPSDFFPDPSVDSILALHRGDEPSFIRFLNGAPGESKLPIPGIEYGSVRADHLRGTFPSFRTQLIEDAFFSINSFYRPGTHCERDLRYLNACYSDMDHDQSLSFAEARKMIIDLEEAGIIPPPSIVARSGNGSWAFWLLRDRDKPSCSPWAWPEKIDFYKRINHEIKEAIETAAPDLCPDGYALDAARVTRIDGSLHIGAGRTTKYCYFHDESNHPHAYTMNELGDFFHVEERPHRSVQARSPEKRRKVSNGVSGKMALAQHRLSDFWSLHDYRKGFWGPPYVRQGCRHYALLLLGKWLRDLGFPSAEVWKFATDVARLAHPPMTVSQIRDALNAPSVSRVSNRKVQEWLQVTQEEVDQIPLKSFGKPHIKQPRKGREARHRMQVEALVDLRLGIEEGQYMSIRALRDYLKGYGLGGALDTVKKVALEAGFEIKSKSGVMQVRFTIAA